MGARILVADDSVTIQKVVELTFSKEDFTLTQARSGEEAIRKAKEVRPDLVLLDLVMPDMNGYDVCSALRAEPALRTMPIILLAGTFESFDRQRGMQAGANDFVTKPFESQVLIGKVKQLLFAKTMDGTREAEPARPSAEAVTVKISSGPAVRGLAPSSPEIAQSAERPSAPPPRSAAPQDELWQLLGSSAAPVAPPTASPEQRDQSRADELASSGPSVGPEDLLLDLGALDLEPLPAVTESAAEALDVLPLPESLSLDDLLATSAEVPAVTTPEDALGKPAPSQEPTFELPVTDAPPLPMVEVEKGEPSALSVDELLRPTPGESTPADTLTLELPELDLTALAESGGATTTEAEPPSALSAETATGVSDLSLEECVTSPLERGVSDLAPPPTPEALPGILLAADFSGPLEPPSGASTPEVFQAAARESGVGSSAVPGTAASVPEDAAQQTTPFDVTPSELAAMREAVTERVAHDLRRELTEKLVERFEKIVWEVVPDLAEILIAKEIERIRRLAEEEKPS